VCTPTRNGILIAADRPTLRDGGYATAFVGKWHLGRGRFDPATPAETLALRPPAGAAPGRPPAWAAGGGA